jgi:hypothetical protein
MAVDRFAALEKWMASKGVKKLAEFTTQTI